MESAASILIVEDDYQESEYLKDILEDIGYNVIGSSASGEEAIDLYKELYADVVIMDIDLNGKLDGIETAKIISEKYGSYIIYLTSLRDKITFKRAKATFPKFFISKPFNKYQLLDVIDQVIDSPKAVKNSNYYNDHFFIKNNQGVYEKYSIDQVSYIKADNTYSDIMLIINDKLKKVTITKGIQTLLDRINNSKIQRVNRSYAINIDKIEFIEKMSVKLYGYNNMITVSKAYQVIFENLIKKL
ncbi:hypothetical protein GCM10011344_27480 [Dokdonia pacifica]|uniref:Two component transcriptional regulator, LytTR family n=1 Tax=Dokdonia pacifica TaxID=1627892 RepID=A0A239CFY3_9FLAO|nr:response regulator [Dokdonia pacifica]GGG25311.1 hypothetical protein GCM10011344_27480 [Dokdonia pacifica]SNS18802.1 two component transcriptional regulator, LytTR family [Dokdonia pacifica]